MVLQQLGVADDGVHRGADVVAHIEQKPRFGCVGGLRLAGGFLQLGSVHGVFIAAQRGLPVAQRNQRGQHKQDDNLKRQYRGGNPPGLGAYLKIPRVIGHRAGNLIAVTAHRGVTLRNDHVLALVASFPNQVFIGGVLQLVNLDFVKKALPVQHQHGKAPELLVSAFIGGVDGVKQQRAGAALHQLKWAGNRVLAAFLGEVGLDLALRVLQEIEPDGVHVARKGIDVLHHAAGGQLNGLDDAVLIGHQLGQGGKLLIADGVAAADDILQQIRFGKVAVELCLHIGNGGFRRVGGLELLLLLGGVVEKGKGSGQQQKAEQKDKIRPPLYGRLFVFSFHI